MCQIRPFGEVRILRSENLALYHDPGFLVSGVLADAGNTFSIISKHQDYFIENANDPVSAKTFLETKVKLLLA